MPKRIALTGIAGMEISSIQLQIFRTLHVVNNDTHVDNWTNFTDHLNRF